MSDEEQTIYVWLPQESASSAPTNAVAPVTDTAIVADGASYITLSNLSFTDLTYFADGYWDGPAQQPSDAAVRINHATSVRVEASNFLASLGGYGVAVGNASVDCAVTGCVFDYPGQGGVIAFGFDADNTTCSAGCASGTNKQPQRLTVSFCVMADLGQTLVHVAGVGLRSASNCRVAHNRVTRCPRYALQADSFYLVQNSRSNVFEFNVLFSRDKHSDDRHGCYRDAGIRQSKCNQLVDEQHDSIQQHFRHCKPTLFSAFCVLFFLPLRIMQP